MRVSFIGCPCSGKTTTAMMVVAQLKEAGISCEFIAEQARVYIAEKRYLDRLKPEQSLVLTDFDQTSIMERQLRMEKIMSSVTGPSMIVVSDSSPLNSLLYMSEDYRDKVPAAILEEAIQGSDLVFYAPPVSGSNGFDPNRVHDQEQSLKVDGSIPSILEKFAPSVNAKAIALSGDPTCRLSQVFEAIINKRFGG